MVERFHIYQLSIPSVPVGGVQNVPLKLDSDAPFSLRMVKSRGIALNGWRFRTPRDQYQSSQLQSDAISDGKGGNSVSKGVPIYPQIVYPPNSVIACDIGNATGSPLVNARLEFWGSKVFQDGASGIPSQSYPKRLSSIPFVYQVPQPGLGSSLLPVAAPLVPVSGTSKVVPGLNCSEVLNNVLNIRQDADFVLRYLAAGAFSLAVDGGATPLPQNFSEVYIRLMDESRKPYMNEPVHIADLFTVGSPEPLAVNNLWNSFFPGLVVPEIYLPRFTAFYFDIFRDDSALSTTAFPVSLYFAFMGAKVFAR